MARHTISLDDQYAAYDSELTQFNLLHFSDRAWRWLNNPIIPLNRLRVSDYRRAFSEGGFQIVDETSQRGGPTELPGCLSRRGFVANLSRTSWSSIPGW